MHISTFVEIVNKMNKVDSTFPKYIRAFFRSIPKLTLQPVKSIRMGVDPNSFDMRLAFDHRGVHYLVIIGLKSRVTPSLARLLVARLLMVIRQLDENTQSNYVVIPMLVSSYLSPQSREICNDHKVAFLDMCGNAEFVSETLLLSREVERKPVSETRKLRSIFSPKGGAILRTMLLEPDRAWKVKDLAVAADSSIGHVSNIRNALMDNEWIEKNDRGVALSQPDMLLQTWRENYRKPRGEFLHGYTYLREGELEQTLNELFEDLMQEEYPPLVYGRNSASQYFAPFLRGTSRFFYANDLGVRLLEDELDLSYVDRGENIVIQVVNDRGILRDSVEVGPRILCTDPITTYLDLWNGNDREREAAEILAQEYFPWLN